MSGNYGEYSSVDTIGLSLLDRGTKVGGLTVFRATLLIVGTNIGVGILSLPTALSETGWIGVLLFLCLVVCLSYTAVMLTWSWLIVVERYHDTDINIKYPYAYMSEKALGKIGRIFTSVMLLATLYGACVVFILLAGEMIHGLVHLIWPGSTVCVWFVIMTGLLVPLSFFNNPQQFWPLAVLGNLTIVVALIGIVVELFLYKPPVEPTYSDLGINSFFLGFTAFFYALGGHAVFPSFMHDMRYPRKFPQSVVYAFAFSAVAYLTMAIAGYYIHGDDVKPNIMLNLKVDTLRSILFICMVVHVWSVFIIAFNVVTQEVEEQIKMTENSFVIRYLVRIVILVGALFICLTLPNFYNVLPLIGATTIPAMAIMLPPILYYKLCNDPDYQKIEIPFYTKLYMIMLLIGGTIIIVIGTYVSVENIINDTTVNNPPCYVKWH